MLYLTSEYRLGGFWLSARYGQSYATLGKALRKSILIRDHLILSPHVPIRLKNRGPSLPQQFWPIVHVRWWRRFRIPHVFRAADSSKSASKDWSIFTKGNEWNRPLSAYQLQSSCSAINVDICIDCISFGPRGNIFSECICRADGRKAGTNPRTNVRPTYYLIF